MPRKLKKSKPLIYVFCEGESEQAYTEFLKNRFKDVAVIKYLKKPGLFEMAEDSFKNNIKCRNEAETINEIWFFFDTETKDIAKWDSRLTCIKSLRRLRKSPGIKIRLLMTSGCIEYWLMLHYKMFAPSVVTVAEKERMLTEVVNREPTYFKGNLTATAKIAENYPAAIEHADKVMNNLLSEGLPGIEESDERNRWLHCNSKTFSTVHEAIRYLESI